MILQNTAIEGVNVIISEPFYDERGFFNRIFCQNELASIRANILIAQINHSMTKVKGSIRGMHFQYPPYAEMKVVHCIKGSIFDVAVDLRQKSPTFLQWHGEILSDENMKTLVIPEGCAHGFQSLEDDIEVIYMSTAIYFKEAENGILFNDPKVDIKWPLHITNISKKDLSYDIIDNNFTGIKYPELLTLK